MQKINILIFPSGAENAIELYQSLRHAPRFHIFGGTSICDHSKFVYTSDSLIENIPYIDAPEFLEKFNIILKEKDIRLVFATHDSVVLHLVKNRKYINATIIGPDLRTSECCRDKQLLYSQLRETPYGTKFYTHDAGECISSEDLPLYAKPARGQGGQHCRMVENLNEARTILADPDMLLCEYLPGAEFTVDCFTDRHGKLLFTGARSREVIKMGIAFVSRTIPMSEEVRSIAEDLNSRLGFRGLWFFQVKQDRHGKLKLLETSARIATTMCLYRQVGVNLPLLSAYDALDMDVKLLNQDMEAVVSRSLKNSYRINIEYDTVYIDYDDTIVSQGKVNVNIIKFLYQCKNEGKKIYLITKHDGDITKNILQMCISPSLFDKIYHIDDKAKKIDLITNKKSIFIDNLFIERFQVYTKTKIPVFDVDAIDSLMSY